MPRSVRTNRATVVLVVSLAIVLAFAVGGAVVALGAGDNNIPGVPLPPSPVSGALDDHTDFDDIYEVPLGFNDKLEVSMTGQAGTQFDMWLWRPGSANVFVDDPLKNVVQSAQTAGTSTEQFWYPARNTGTYYLHVFNPLDGSESSAGTYAFTYKVTRLPAPVVVIKAPATVSWGKSASIVGTATVGGKPFSGARVLLQAKAQDSTSWKDLNLDSAAYRPKTVATENGAFSFSVVPSRKTEYRAVVWPTEDTGWRISAPSTVTPRIRLGAVHVPSSVKKSRLFTAYGYFAPRHTTGAKTVTLTFSKGSRVVRVKAVNSRHSSAKWGTASKYKARVSLPSKGKWKVVATAPADSLHAATTSSARYITVK